MGIPSFYKHLLQTITGLTDKTRDPPSLFALDLNCAIYHCVRKVQKVTPYTEESKAQWEKKLIDSVLAYIQQMSNVVKPTEAVYVAVDGVAPMAKIKQQRARRFKSGREAKMMAQITAEAKNKPYVEEPRWDTTAITPGTQFMEKLAEALRAYASRNPKVIVSPADEPGEGEQKIMNYIRLKRPESSVVYGLDADLIVLSLLTSTMISKPVDLFREEVEFNGAVKMSLDTEQFLYMNMQHLSKILYERYARPNASQPEFVYDFVGLMSLLGNDFVPHSLALKIRDDGIPKLMDIYKRSTSSMPLVDSNTWTYRHESLLQLFQILQAEEPTQVLRSIKHKLEARVGSTGSKDPVDQALARYSDTPVLWGVESSLVKYESAGAEKPMMSLVSSWESTYDRMVYGQADTHTVTKLYLEAVAWTLAYYAGKPVDTWFYYPWFLPPRFGTIVHWLSANRIQTPIADRPDLTPQNQLAMVLPAESYSLLPAKYQSIPIKFPHLFPTNWSVYSFGRRFMWECEPMIPLIHPNQIIQMV